MAKVKGRRNRIKYLLISIAKIMYEEGKYKSKHMVIEENYKKYNMRETHLIHDYPTYEKYKDIAAMFANYLRSNYNIKYESQLMKLSKEELYQYISEYINYLRDVEKLSQNKIRNYILALSKMLIPVRPDIREFFITSKNRFGWRDLLLNHDFEK